MTTPESNPVTRWHTELLGIITHLSAEHTRVADRGHTGYDGTDAEAREAWQSHLDGLAAQREHAEQAAMSAGLREPAIHRARQQADTISIAPQQVPASATTGVPEHVAEFFTDMLTVDMFHLERIAMLTAARQHRLDTGQYGFEPSPHLVAAVERNMNLLHLRISALAAAAELTPAEGHRFWNTQPEHWRHLTRVTAHTMNDLELEHAWRGYAFGDTDPAIPPYIPVDPHTNLPIGIAHTIPPTPSELITLASTALISPTPTTAGTRADGAAPTGQTVEAALPADTTRTWAPGESPEATASPSGPDIGPDP
ncbi:hypothetical protein K7711_19230 [Nocardia sp. CA2R105]|uniref:hypothetical protein n=1 Tax=Nocardia coffeae TaxID=2873381 RepID=UPI001CA73B6A|nr:hypothetical protein [Nocardia coffeae]MBY8858620.1 hypothetical protein [Nocardia coffeae]